jgi:allantoin racemase
MRLLLINPNTSAGITDLIVAAGRRAASPDVEIVGVTARFGARYIGSRAAAAIAGHAALDAWAQAIAEDPAQAARTRESGPSPARESGPSPARESGPSPAQAARTRDSGPSPAQAARTRDSGLKYDGVMLACFGDPGLLALREMSSAPVTGMAEASCQAAARMGRRFSIITGGVRWRPMLEEFVAMIGLSHQLASVRTVAPTGAEIAADPEAAHAMLAAACNSAAAEDGADVVILGGAGLLGIAGKIADRVPVPLLDCMVATMGALEGMARARRPAGAAAKAPPVETIGLEEALRREMEG